MEWLDDGKSGPSAETEGEKFRRQIESRPSPRSPHPEAGRTTRPASPQARVKKAETSAARAPSPPVSLRPKSRPVLLYWLFAVALIPLGVSLMSEEEQLQQRVDRTVGKAFEDLLETEPDKAIRLLGGEELTDDEFFELIPEHKLEGAHLSHGSMVQWLYAFLAAAGFAGAIWLLFQPGKATMKHILWVGLCTATAGILFLFVVQWIAEFTQNWIVVGRSILVIVFYIFKFIGFSYRAAMDPANGFLLSFLGFTCGVGLCEELCKLMPVVFRLRDKGDLGWRGACVWGLASGVGFGVAEGIMYSSGYYNGISTGGIYAVRFISCVALHAIWGGAAAISLFRRRGSIQGDLGVGEWLATLLWVMAVPMILHGLYDTLLKKEMNGLALLVAVASFAWLIIVTEWTRHEEGAFYTAEEAKPRRTQYA